MAGDVLFDSFGWVTNSGYTGSVCPKCCKPYYTLYPSTADGAICECTDEIKSKSPKQYGWVCPACNCGNAPWSSKCGHCKGIE